jgi:hypothetical protein
MKLTVRKVLRIKLRSTDKWEPDRVIDGLKEEDTDLVILDKNGLEVARFTAADYESWVVEAQCVIEP